MKGESEFGTDVGRWQAVMARDPAAAGAFLYGVVTTGIYCRPGCTSRRPNRENVRFFKTGQAAEDAGFRACKRCRPNGDSAGDEANKAIVRACQLIETAERPPTLQQLADEVGMSKYHFHRLFKKVVGITPKQYATEKRLERARSHMQAEGTITEAIYMAGFESGSRFYEQATPALGMKPAAYKRGGKGVAIRYAIVESYLGWMLVAASEQGVCRIDFGESAAALRAALAETFPQAELMVDDPQFDGTVSRVLAFLERPVQGLALPLDIQGTAFQRRVWAALQQIPAGQTASYGQVAADIGQPKAVRAVAQACGANKIAVAVPCHRVVRSNGELGGYRWGVERKQAILKREAEGMD